MKEEEVLVPKKCDGNCDCEQDNCSTISPPTDEAEKIIQELLAEVENEARVLRVSRVFPTLRDDSGKKLGRNDSCPCGSDKKWKKCCLKSF